MRYIEQNPVRANMVKAPAHYPWSSYRANGQGKADPLIKPHPQYLALGQTQHKRGEAYKALFKTQVDAQDVKDIRAAWQTGTPLGNKYFKEKLARKLKCKVGYASRGRPRKE